MKAKQEPRLTAWPVDRYFPPALQRLQRSLEDLYLAAHPTLSGSVSSVGGPAPDSHEPPGVAFNKDGHLVTNQFRHAIKRCLARVDRLAESIELELSGGRSRPRPGWRCPSCNRFQRDSAAFCDRCSPQVARPESHANSHGGVEVEEAQVRSDVDE